jgi:type 1 glutamine amidotransferase
VRTDEWYNFISSPRGQARVLASLDETTYQGGTRGKDHPIAWCKQVGKGRIWYTALGHTEASYTEPLFLKHLLGGIQAAAGTGQADFKPRGK